METSSSIRSTRSYCYHVVAAVAVDLSQVRRISVMTYGCN